VQQIEAGVELVKGGLRARHGLAHGVEDELRLQRWFRWRRGEILTRSKQTSSQSNRIEEKSGEISPQIRPLARILEPEISELGTRRRTLAPEIRTGI
jgi:hypothetical protein